MTLKPELENQIRADTERDQTPQTRRALVASLRGRSVGSGPTVDEFLDERSAEARESRDL